MCQPVYTELCHWKKYRIWWLFLILITSGSQMDCCISSILWDPGLQSNLSVHIPSLFAEAEEDSDVKNFLGCQFFHEWELSHVHSHFTDPLKWRSSLSLSGWGVIITPCNITLLIFFMFCQFSIYLHLMPLRYNLRDVLFHCNFKQAQEIKNRCIWALEDEVSGKTTNQYWWFRMENLHWGHVLCSASQSYTSIVLNNKNQCSEQWCL